MVQIWAEAHTAIWDGVVALHQHTVLRQDTAQGAEVIMVDTNNNTAATNNSTWVSSNKLGATCQLPQV